MDDIDPSAPPTSHLDTTEQSARQARAASSPGRSYTERIVRPLPITPRTIRFERSLTPATTQRRQLRFTPFRISEDGQASSPAKRLSDAVLQDISAKRPRTSEENVGMDQDAESTAGGSGSLTAMAKDKGKQRAADHVPGPNTAATIEHSDLHQQSQSELEALYMANERQVQLNRSNKIEHLQNPECTINISSSCS